MEGVNPFIKNNKHRMIMFLDELGVSFVILNNPKSDILLESPDSQLYFTSLELFPLYL